MVFQNEDSSYVNPLMDYVEQAKTIQWWHEFLRDEMTLKTTLLVWELMVAFNGLVSWVTGPNKRLWPLMTSTSTNVFFSTRANLYCRTNSLSIKHVDVPKLKNVWASIITSFLHLTLVPKNMVLGFKIGWDHFHYMMHQSPTSWLWICNRDGACCMWSTFFWTFMSTMT